MQTKTLTPTSDSDIAQLQSTAANINQQTNEISRHHDDIKLNVDLSHHKTMQTKSAVICRYIAGM